MKKHHLKEHIGYWINRLRSCVHHAFELRIQSHDITTAGWAILVALYDNFADSVQGLSDYVEVDKASISRVVEKLVTKGFVLHTTGKDRRCGHIELTARGKKLVPVLLQEAEENEKQFFGHLAPKEAKELQNILKSIFEHIPTVTMEGYLK